MNDFMLPHADAGVCLRVVRGKANVPMELRMASLDTHFQIRHKHCFPPQHHELREFFNGAALQNVEDHLTHWVRWGQHHVRQWVTPPLWKEVLVQNQADRKMGLHTLQIAAAYAQQL